MAVTDNRIYLGDKPWLSVEIRNPKTGVLTDPDTLVLEIHHPSMAMETLTYTPGAGLITRLSVGSFECVALPMAQKGPTKAKWVGTMLTGGKATLVLEFIVY